MAWHFQKHLFTPIIIMIILLLSRVLYNLLFFLMHVYMSPFYLSLSLSLSRDTFFLILKPVFRVEKEATLPFLFHSIYSACMCVCVKDSINSTNTSHSLNKRERSFPLLALLLDLFVYLFEEDPQGIQQKHPQKHQDQEQPKGSSHLIFTTHSYLLDAPGSQSR
jgi:hypothetical protein